MKPQDELRKFIDKVLGVSAGEVRKDLIDEEVIDYKKWENATHEARRRYLRNMCFAVWNGEDGNSQSRQILDWINGLIEEKNSSSSKGSKATKGSRASKGSKASSSKSSSSSSKSSKSKSKSKSSRASKGSRRNILTPIPEEEAEEEIGGGYRIRMRKKTRKNKSYRKKKSNRKNKRR